MAIHGAGVIATNATIVTGAERSQKRIRQGAAFGPPFSRDHKSATSGRAADHHADELRIVGGAGLPLNCAPESQNADSGHNGLFQKNKSN